MIKTNPYIKGIQRGCKKVYSWLCFNMKVPVLTVNGCDSQPEINLNVKSLLAAFKANGYKITKE